MQFNRKLATRAAALALIGGAGVTVLGGAAPAFAAGGPSDSAQATVTVNQTISFAFTSPASFSLNPGVKQANAIQFNVQTNDNHGYSVSLAASGDPQTLAGASFPTGDLVYDTSRAGDGQISSNVQLSNSAAVFASKNIMPGMAGDQYSQDWTANLPSNTPPGAYSTTLTYVATGL